MSELNYCLHNAPMWVNSHGQLCDTSDKHVYPPFPSYRLEKPPDTVGQPPRTEIGVPNMPSWKAKKLRKLLQEKVLLEL
jgi:hypothetical protein